MAALEEILLTRELGADLRTSSGETKAQMTK